MAKRFDDLRRKMPPPRQDRARKRTDVMLADVALSELRRSLGVTQEKLAKVLDVRQAAVSKLEGRDDLLLSTVAAYVRALGGTLEVIARFGDQVVRLDPRGATSKVRMVSTLSGLKRARMPPKAKTRS